MPVRRAAGRVEATRSALEEELACREAIEALDFPKTIPDGWARRHLLPFILRGFPKYEAGWFHRKLAETMEWFSRAVANGESPRLIITVPPRHGKSEIVSRRWPVWHLGMFPDHELVLASYGQSLANDMSRDARQVRNDNLDLFPGLQARADKDGVEQWKIVGGRGGYKAVGVGGPLTGSGAHALIIDDPVKDRVAADSPVQREAVWQWYQTVASTRLAPGAGVLVMMTRWHEDDLVGRLLEAERTGQGDSWRKVDFPAIAESDEEHRAEGEALHPERYPIEVLEQRRKVLGSRNFAALFQQRPTPASGSVFQRGWMQHFSMDPQRLAPTLDEVIITVDATFDDTEGADFVVMQAWGRRGWAELFLLDQVRARMAYPVARKALRMLRAKWSRATRVVIEKKANGAALLRDLESVVSGLIPFNPDPHGSKKTRAEVAATRFEALQVWLPSPEWCPWVGDYVEELCTFPAGKNDDQVDGTSMAVIDFQEREGRSYEATNAALDAWARRQQGEAPKAKPAEAVKDIDRDLYDELFS